MLMKFGVVCVCRLAWDRLRGEGGEGAGKTFLISPPIPCSKVTKNLVRNKEVHQNDATHKVCRSTSTELAPGVHRGAI